MGMIGSRVNLHLAEDLASHAVLGKHALDSLLDDPFGDALLELDERLLLHGTGAAGLVAAVNLIRHLLAAHGHLLRVDDHHVGAHVHGRGVRPDVAAAEVRRDEGGEAAEAKTLRVDHDPGLPAAVGVLTLGVVGSVEKVLRA